MRRPPCALDALAVGALALILLGAGASVALALGGELYPHGPILWLGLAVVAVAAARRAPLMRPDLAALALVPVAAFAALPLARAGAPEALWSLVWTGCAWPAAAWLGALRGRWYAGPVAGCAAGAVALSAAAGWSPWLLGALLAGAGILWRWPWWPGALTGGLLATGALGVLLIAVYPLPPLVWTVTLGGLSLSAATIWTVPRWRRRSL